MNSTEGIVICEEHLNHISPQLMWPYEVGELPGEPAKFAPCNMRIFAGNVLRVALTVRYRRKYSCTE